MASKLRNPIYLQIRKVEVERTEDVGEKGQVLIDYNEDGEIVGVEILVDCEVRCRDTAKLEAGR